MRIFPFFDANRTSFFLLLFLYCGIIFFILPVALGIFLSTLLYPVLKWFSNTFRIHYYFVVLIGSALCFYLSYLSIHFFIQSFSILMPQLQQYFSHELFQHPLLQHFSSISITLIDQFTSFIIETSKNMFHHIFELLIFLMAFYFSLFESKRNPYWFFIYTPASVRKQWQNYYARATQLFTTFLFVELRLVLLTFLLLTAGFMLLNFSYPVQKALFIALADCLPFFGIGLIMIPLAIYFYITDQLFLCLAIVLLYVFIQVTRQLTESFLWASTFHLRTIHTFVISAASVLLFGFYGILLSPFLLLLAVKLKQQPIFAR